MNICDFKGKINGEKLSKWYASKLYDEAQIRAAEQLLSFYLEYTEKEINEILSNPNSEEYRKVVPYIVFGEPDLINARNLIEAALWVLRGEYDLPDAYVEGELSVAEITFSE